MDPFRATDDPLLAESADDDPNPEETSNDQDAEEDEPVHEDFEHGVYEGNDDVEAGDEDKNGQAGENDGQDDDASEAGFDEAEEVDDTDFTGPDWKGAFNQDLEDSFGEGGDQDEDLDAEMLMETEMEFGGLGDVTEQAGEYMELDDVSALDLLQTQEPLLMKASHQQAMSPTPAASSLPILTRNVSPELFDEMPTDETTWQRETEGAAARPLKRVASPAMADATAMELEAQSTPITPAAENQTLDDNAYVHQPAPTRPPIKKKIKLALYTKDYILAHPEESFVYRSRGKYARGDDPQLQALLAARQPAQATPPQPHLPQNRLRHIPILPRPTQPTPQPNPPQSAQSAPPPPLPLRPSQTLADRSVVPPLERQLVRGRRKWFEDNHPGEAIRHCGNGFYAFADTHVPSMLSDGSRGLPLPAPTQPAQTPPRQPAQAPLQQPAQTPLQQPDQGASLPPRPLRPAHSKRGVEGMSRTDFRRTLSEIELAVSALRKGSDMTWEQIAARLNKDMPRADVITAQECQRIQDAVDDKLESWSSEDCFLEIQALETLAAERRRWIERDFDSGTRETGDNIDPSLQEAGPVLTPQQPDFAPRDYEELPEVVIRHMVRERGLTMTQRVDVANRTHRHLPLQYRDYALALMADDAARGIAPLRPRALDVWSNPPTTHDIVDLQQLAVRNRQLLREHFEAHGGDLDEQGEFINPYAPQTQSYAPLQQANATHLQTLFQTRFPAQTPARLRRLINGKARRVPRPEAMLQMLWYLDAREGIDPPMPSHGPTHEHHMSREGLVERAMRTGVIKSRAEASGLSMDDLRVYLATQGVSDEATDVSVEEIGQIIQALGEDLIHDLRRAGFAVSSAQSLNNLQDAAVTFNRRLVASRPAFRQLERTIRRSHFPDHVSSDNWLCGMNALIASLNATRRHYGRGLRLFTVNEVMQQLWRDWDPAMATTYDPLTPGNPTIGFGFFVRRRINENFGLPPFDEQHEQIFGEMTTINMAEQGHLQLVLEYLHLRGWLERPYSLGVVTGAQGPRGAAAAHVIGNDSLDTAVVWLYHDNAQNTAEARSAARSGVQLVGHWSPFIAFGERTELVDSWGLRRPGVELLPGRKIMKKRGQMSKEEKEKNDRINENRRRKKALRKCFNCQESGEPCTIRGKSTDCAECEDREAQCDWDEASARPVIISGVAGLTEEQIRSWDKPIEEWELEMLERVTQLAIPTTLPDNCKEYAVHVHSMRCSSQPTAAYMAMLLQRLPGFQHNMQALLNSGQNIPEANLLGGVPMPIQFYGMVFARRGILPVPTQLTNGLNDPRLIGFVNLMHHLTSPATPPPRAIIISTSGFAGLSVDVWGFGDRGRGLFGLLCAADRRNNNTTNLAGNTYLVSIIQHHVHHGFPHSMPQASRQWFSHHHNKYLIANKLEDLVDRFAAIIHYATLNQQVPVFNGNQDLSDRLDAHIDLLAGEHDWRAHWLSPQTNPTDLTVRLRNFARNGPWV